MSLYGSNDAYPTTWSEMSFELKGLFAYHITMAVMMVIGKALSFVDQVFVALSLALSIAIASAVRRLRHNWRWRGVGSFRALGALAVTAMIAYFVLAGTNFSLSRFVALAPWALAGVGIGVFAVLNILRIVHFSEKGFLAEGGHRAEIGNNPPPEPRWKARVRLVFVPLFIIVWLQVVTAFYLFSSTFESGSPTPAADRTHPLTNHGVTLYVTAFDGQLVDQMLTFAMISVPVTVLMALFLQGVLKINLNPFASD